MRVLRYRCVCSCSRYRPCYKQVIHNAHNSSLYVQKDGVVYVSNRAATCAVIACKYYMNRG